MPDYDFSGLNSRSFEHMVQALSCKILGPGLVVFGDGPDGGREATFTGKTGHFPSTDTCWDGYVVVQAKFRLRPTGKTHEDGQWVLKELKKELDDFLDKDMERKKPEYYIFVTNVVLSPMQEKGTKDKAASLISEYQHRIGMTDYRIWDFDQLCRFLDADQSVRNAYQVWITAGDVFAKLASALESKCPDFKKVMTNYLQKELLDDHYSKLEQAGHSPESRVPLEQVFIDLPVFKERRPEAPNEGNDGMPLQPGFLAAVIQMGTTCLKPGSWTSMEMNPTRMEHLKGQEAGRYVLIGGPGQGKSTLAQFLCQTHRAQLLQTASDLDADARNVVDSIIQQCSDQEIPVNLARRFPIRVELASFAKALATEGSDRISSLLMYLGDRIKQRTDYDVTADHLRAWLHEYPWLVILDGLDEVPASSNRTQVIDATKDFLVDIATCEADVLLITTTRPQGYNAEFSPERYQDLWLAPLSVPRALHYGEMLVHQTYQHDSQREADVLSRLQDAATVDATARLMESPLQVTIMAQLLAQIAKPPQERYKLFQQYYKVIYKREMERGVSQLSQLLRDYETDIDVIHYRTGLLLQIESERTQHTDATLSIDEFKEIVQHRLDNEGHSEDSRLKMTEAIVRCATDRLVFLVPTQSERVGFEIRSLQEFMASEALMDGGDREVISRIRKIATVPFWQNVLLFAAGKCFAERQWLRDNVSEICAEMNDDPEDPLGHAVFAGSHLALSLLEDGPARRQPAYSHSLARRALDLLGLPPSDVHDRLADIYEPAFEGVFREEIQQRMDSQRIQAQLGAWQVLLRLVHRQSAVWSTECAEANWPTDIKGAQQILQVLDPTSNPWLWEKYRARFFEMPLLTSAHMFHRENELRPEQERFVTTEAIDIALKTEGMWWEERDVGPLVVQVTDDSNITAYIEGIGSVSENLDVFSGLPPINEYWVPLVEARRFVSNPTSQTLAEALERIADCTPINPRPKYIDNLPWPIAMCIQSTKDSEDLSTLTQRIRSGDLGDITDWSAAELRWADQGISIEDLKHITDERWPIGGDIAEKGFPLAGGIFMWDGGEEPERALLEFWSLLSGSKAKNEFAPLMLNYFFRDYSRGGKKRLRGISKEINNIKTEILETIQTPKYMSIETVLSIADMWKGTNDEYGVLDAIGRVTSDFQPFGREGFYHYKEYVPERISQLTEILVSAVESDPLLHGVLNLLVLLSSHGEKVRIPSNLDLLLQSNDREIVFAGHVLSVCQESSNAEDSAKLVDTLLKEWHDDQEALDQFLDCSRAQMIDQPDADLLFLQLWEGVDDRYVQTKQRTLQIMMDLLSRRVTNLQELTVWDQLSLPDGLCQVFNQ